MPPPVVDTPTEEIAARLAPFPEIRFALLFGSRARGDARADSDIDVAAFVEPASTPRQRFDLRVRIGATLEDLGHPDVVVLNDAPPLLAHRALMGRLLLNRDPEGYVRFFVKTLALSNDEQHWRDIHARAREERLREGRFGRP